jgi:hypothetical protein
MTSPLEAMAKSWAESEDAAWENQLPEDRAYMISVMRTALLVLAESELPEACLTAADDTCVARIGRARDSNELGSVGLANELNRDVFRAMLRAIAEDQA